MAGSIATLAILWVSLQTMGFLGHSHSIGTHKLPESLQTYLASYTGKYLLQFNFQFNSKFHTAKHKKSNFMIIANTAINTLVGNISVEISIK